MTDEEYHKQKIKEYKEARNLVKDDITEKILEEQIRYHQKRLGKQDLTNY